MRILVVHNFYEWRGGEDAVVEAEIALLEQHGHEVRLYARHANELRGLGRLALARNVMWSSRSAREIDAILDGFPADVVHVHNTVPLVSPSVFSAATRRGVPVVQTLHNFRLACLAGTLMRDGAPCEACIGHSPLQGVMHGCYRGSRLQSAGLATSLVAHRLLGTHHRHVARFIALTEAARETLVRAGLPADRTVVKPNAADVPAPSAASDAIRAGGLYVGRLSTEKGVEVLVRALERLEGARIDVVGEGPLGRAIETNARLRMRGRLAPADVFAAMRRSAFLVVPSICAEGFPRVVAEAFGSGLPIIASRIGGLAEIIEHERTGLLVPPGDPDALADAIARARARPAEMRAFGARARAVWERLYSPARNHEQLMEIYRGVLPAPATTAGAPALAAGR